MEKQLETSLHTAEAYAKCSLPSESGPFNPSSHDKCTNHRPVPGAALVLIGPFDRSRQAISWVT